jgi:hypothetical protein
MITSIAKILEARAKPIRLIPVEIPSGACRLSNRSVASSAPLVEGLKKRRDLGAIGPESREHCLEGGMAMVAHFPGEQVRPNVDAGVELVTQENVNSSAIRSPLKPIIAS